MMSINDNMDEEFLEEFLIDSYGEDCTGKLKEISISDINPDSEDLHIQDEYTQTKYNNMMEGDFDPIILFED